MSSSAPIQESIRLHRNRFERKVSATIRIIEFKDKDTKDHIIYAPSLEITAYGSTEAKAKEMFQESLKSYFSYLFNMSNKEMKDELVRLGWKQDIFAHKNYSHAYVDKDGLLQNFDINADEVREDTLRHEAVV